MLYKTTLSLSFIAALLLHSPVFANPTAQPDQPARNRNLASSHSLSTAEIQARLPANSRVVRDISFKDTSSQNLKLDLYLPAQHTQAMPLIVWVHGGAWKQGRKEDILRNPQLLNALLNEGYAVAAVSYRVSGQAKFPAQIQDINDATQFLWQNSQQYGLDKERIAIAGRSAGAHLAGLAATSNAHHIKDFITSAQTPSFKLRAFVGFFGPYDLNTLNDGKSNRTSNQSSTALFLGASPADQPQLAATASPIHYVNSATPPMLLLHGTDDKQVPASQSEQLKKRLDALNIPNQLHLATNARHGDPVFDTQEYVDKFIHFMRHYFPVRAQ